MQRKIYNLSEKRQVIHTILRNMHVLQEMKKQIAILLVASLGVLTSGCDALRQLTGETLTIEEIARGLKEALEIGVGEGANALSQVDGYFKGPYKILLPPEARKVTDRLKFIPGFTQAEEIILEKINRGAEDAAKSAKPIFVDAIRKMTFQDAAGILLGEKNAATVYLHQATYEPLYIEFHPVIVNSLNKFNAIEYWADAVNAYNKIPFVEKANPNLDEYVTQKALDGMFSMVELKERQIRADVSQRTTDLLKKVFAKQD